MIRCLQVFVLLLFPWSFVFSLQDVEPIVLFTSQDPVYEKLISYIEQEEESIHMAVCSFSDYTVAKALCDATRRGVKVVLLVDCDSIRKRSPIEKMVKNGIAVYVWHPQDSISSKGIRPHMQHKFCLFGPETVWTGSYDISKNRTRLNKGNVVIIKQEALRKKFMFEFENLIFREAIPYELFCKRTSQNRVRNTKK